MKIDFKESRFDRSLDAIIVDIDDELIQKILEALRTSPGYLKFMSSSVNNMTFSNMLRSRTVGLGYAIKLQRELGVEIVTQEDVDNAIDSFAITLRQSFVLH
jgi:hypothetical protein